MYKAHCGKHTDCLAIAVL